MTSKRPGLASARFFSLILTFCPGLLHAAPLGFKGVDIGSPLAQIASNPRHECRPVNTPIGDTVCGLRPRETETIAGASVVSLYYFYDAGRLNGIQITLAEKDFQKVVDALGVKYGAGTLAAAPIRNPNGATFEQRIWTWQRGEESLRAERYSGRLDRSILRITDDSAARRVQQRRAVKDPSKDL
ncbi:MAG: hypothetical protein HZB71_12605 [Betaproteobacteria bacterium]|nr:hypothetical protein [Betaproteobacteria bacterium]